MHFLNWPIITYPQFQLIKGLQVYLPQQFLYFLPLPQAPFLSILSLYLVHIVLWLLALFYGHLVHIIISIICIINITNNLFNVDKMWTKSSYILSFVSKEIISYIDYLINVDKKALLVFSKNALFFILILFVLN